MCGIVGIIGREAVAGELVEALKRLEYRGYDSAGIATLEHGRLARRRAEGKLKNLEARLAREPLAGSIGIGHTRWATHGAPNEVNAHPHATDKLAVVHNGIIENYRALREELERDGAKFVTETDTEVIAHLVTQAMKAGKAPVEAVTSALPRLKGAFALAFIFDGEDNLMVGARKGSPLAVGYGTGEMYLGSDAIALAPFTEKIAYLEEGDLAVMTRSGSRFATPPARPWSAKCRLERRRRLPRRQGQPPPLHAQGNPRAARGGGPHARLHARHGERARAPAGRRCRSTSKISTASSSPPAAPRSMPDRSAKYWFERFARLPVDLDIASEFRYRDMPLAKNGLAIFVSQSGETADTLASLRYAKEHGQHVLSVVNVPAPPSPAKATSRCARSPAPRSASPRPRPSPASSRRSICLAVAAGRARGVLSELDEKRLVARADRGAAPHGRGAAARTRDRAPGACARACPRRALSRPRHQLPDRARRRAQAEGDFLHPRRGLRRAASSSTAPSR